MSTSITDPHFPTRDNRAAGCGRREPARVAASAGLARVVSWGGHGGGQHLGALDAVEAEVASLLGVEVDGVDARLPAVHQHRHHAYPPRALDQVAVDVRDR